ncbi:hypothetical protein FAI41_06940 [Acetobacteraceae bacterium]|nr:hypothetical protein FAI41_06940 [Acetobacteraceae bacterium]
MIQMFKKRGVFRWGAFLVLLMLPLRTHSFPILHQLPQNDLVKAKSAMPVVPVETHSLAEIWDNAREREEEITFVRNIPTVMPDEVPKNVFLIVFPKVTSGSLIFGKDKNAKPIFGKEGHRYPPLISYEGDQLTLFQLIQSGRRACEITMTIQQGKIITAKESIGCVDYESKGHLLSKALIGAKILPPPAVKNLIDSEIRKSGAT